MSAADSQPRLRLVGSDDPPATASHRPVPTPPDRIAEENRAASRNLSLDPTDPRWVLAVRAYSQLQGTMLTFERRQRLMRLATQLGVRPFDVNIIIAIVQDHARRGADLSQAAGTIALLEQPSVHRSSAWNWARWITAVATAVVATALLIQWLTAG